MPNLYAVFQAPNRKCALCSEYDNACTSKSSTHYKPDIPWIARTLAKKGRASCSGAHYNNRSIHCNNYRFLPYYGKCCSCCSKFRSAKLQTISYWWNVAEYSYIMTMTNDKVRSRCLSSSVLQGCVAGGRDRGRPRMSWLDNIISWAAHDVHSLLAAARDRFLWRSLVHTCSVEPRRP